MSSVNIKDLDPAEVLSALHEHAGPAEGFHKVFYEPDRFISVEYARQILNYKTIFGIIAGRPLYVVLQNDEFDTRLYNQYNGEGAAEKALSKLRKMAR